MAFSLSHKFHYPTSPWPLEISLIREPEHSTLIYLTLPLQALLKMKFLLFADEKKVLKNDKRRKNGDFLCKQKKSGEANFREGGNLYKNIYPTKWYRGWRSYRLIIPQESTFLLLSGRWTWEMPDQIGSNSSPTPPDLITSGRKEHGTVCCLPLTHTHLLPCFLCYSANFIFFGERREKKKKGCKRKAQSTWRYRSYI